MKTVDDILREKGPSLSSEVVGHLIANGMTAAGARKRVSRANGSVKRIKGFHFPNREKFLFIGDQEVRVDFRDKLAEALINSGSCYGRALLGLKSHSGTVLEQHFPIASGLPVDKARGHILHSFAEEKLREHRLIEDLESADGKLISIWTADGLTTRRRAAMFVEEVVLSVLRSWLIKPELRSRRMI